jgi:hypothetical protein
MEADETYIGGREKGIGGGVPCESQEPPVLALLERGGDVRSFPLERATLKNIKPIMEKHIDPTSHLVTYESSIYCTMKPDYAKHSTVNHSRNEYVRRLADGMKVTTNMVESFFGLLKRSNYGIDHHMSRKYLGSYCADSGLRLQQPKDHGRSADRQDAQVEPWKAINAQCAEDGLTRAI